MTMFSANTFVVWGSIAFDVGMVAVMINLMYGVAALLAGYFVASRWKAMGVETPAEYIRIRFGTGALHFYTWSMMVLRVIGTAAALYALAKILVALMPLGEGNPLRDPETGNLSLRYAILIFGSIVVLYTMIGGLWAVLMTDVLQFIILNLAVLFVVPLALHQVGGISGFIEQAPEGFFDLVKEEKYTVFFLAGWAAIHFFMIGAEWAFVQRYLCVPTQKDARKSTYLFGALYLFSPLLWLLPPMIYRITNPEADAEQAYILACKSVLPVGMVGLMLAAMFSATASMVSSQLNVFSGVLTNDIYKPLAKATNPKSLLKAGRFFTILLGVLLVIIALEIEKWGQVKDLIISITELMVVPLLAPALWGIFSRKIGGRAVWITGLSGFGLGLLVRFGFGADGFLSHPGSAQQLGGRQRQLPQNLTRCDLPRRRPRDTRTDQQRRKPRLEKPASARSKSQRRSRSTPHSIQPHCRQGRCCMPRHLWCYDVLPDSRQRGLTRLFSPPSVPFCFLSPALFSIFTRGKS